LRILVLLLFSFFPFFCVLKCSVYCLCSLYLYMFIVLVLSVFVLVYVHCTICAVLCDLVRCMCCFLVECMFLCKHCHRAKAQLQLSKYITYLLHYICVNTEAHCYGAKRWYYTRKHKRNFGS
jgi:hypothetical protein